MSTTSRSPGGWWPSRGGKLGQHSRPGRECTCCRGPPIPCPQAGPLLPHFPSHSQHTLTPGSPLFPMGRVTSNKSDESPPTGRKPQEGRPGFLPRLAPCCAACVWAEATEWGPLDCVLSTQPRVWRECLLSKGCHCSWCTGDPGSSGRLSRAPTSNLFHLMAHVKKYILLFANLTKTIGVILIDLQNNNNSSNDLPFCSKVT